MLTSALWRVVTTRYALQSPYQMGTFALFIFVPFRLVDSSISKRLSCGAISPFENAARFDLPPHGLLDRQIRENEY